MPGWFDELLEELQRRQEEQDARREGRPLPPRGRRGPRPLPREDQPEEGGAGRGPFERAGDGGVWRRYGGGIRIAVIAVGVLLLLTLSGAAIGFITDVWWYEALGRSDVLFTRLFAQLGLFATGAVAFAVPALVSVAVARRLAPAVPVRRVGGLDLPDVSRIALIGILVGVVVLAIGFGAAWGGSWEEILLFANGGDFGTADPHFGLDVGFFVFDLPFWRFLQGWAVTALVAIIALTLGVYAAAAMRWRFRLTAPVRAHVSILGALLLVAIAVGYQLDTYELAYSTRGIGGAMHAVSYTDQNAQRPAFLILTVVALASAALLLANIWFRTLWLLALAVGAWFGLSIVVGGLYPAFVQRFSVEPNELAQERPFIREHVAATRQAFDLETIDERDFTGEAPLSRELFEAEAETLNNARLWDYRALLTTFGQQQILRQYYDFLDVDIDRYEIDGEQRQIMLAAREINVAKLDESAKTWTSERLFYTHGYGITAVPVNAVTPEGQPDYLVSGIGREPELPVGEPRIYFGEVDNGYSIVGTRTAEFDRPEESAGSDAVTTWSGTTGVRLDNILARALFALRFGDLNMFITDQLTDDSQILFRRQIDERVAALAPFLVYDPDPYLVSADDRLVWLWDAYTVSNRYPNAQPLQRVYPGANYLRNSVKVAIDAYDGSVRFFVADTTDPIIAAYGRIFPGLFEPLDAMPDALRAHIRYPEGLFRAQTEAYLIYHVPADDRGAAIFYSKEDVWAIPTQQGGVGGGEQEVEPYYVIMRIPGADAAEFVLIQPIVAANRPNMVAWLAARNDGDRYGERISFRFPSDTTTLGPAQVEARIDQNDTISSQFGVWQRSGSSIIRGNLLVLPMGDSVLYLEPIFLQSQQAAFPEFVRVILVSQTRVAFARTLDEALRQVLGEAPLPPPVEEGEEEPAEEPEESPAPGATGEPLPDDLGALVAEAQRLYDEAQSALDAGDLGTYQARIDELGEVLERIGELAPGE